MVKNILNLTHKQSTLSVDNRTKFLRNDITVNTQRSYCTNRAKRIIHITLEQFTEISRKIKLISHFKTWDGI